jgi:acyl-CoA thioesterase-1
MKCWKKGNNMNKRIIFFTSIIILSCCKSNFEIITIEPMKLNITENSTVVCFGDSLTFGHGSDIIDDSFPMVLQEKIKIPVINSGVNDDTTADGLTRIQKET